MKKFLKNGMVLFLAFAMMGGTVYAKLPNAYWKPHNGYLAAKEKGNTAERIKYAEQIIAIMEKEPASAEKTNILATRYDELARYYEEQKQYAKAKMYYEKYIPYGTQKGWTDGVVFAKNKLRLLSTTLEVYKETSNVTAPFYGAKFEPKKGVYYGSVYDKDPEIGIRYDHEAIRAKYPEEESLLLAYLEFGHEPSRLQNYFELAKAQNKAILLAWNTHGSTFETMHYQGAKPANVQKYIDDTLQYIAEQGVPVFLRFANEMNVGDNGKDPKAYVDTFRQVAKKAKAKSNIAMVWAPNDVASNGGQFEKYYPGEEYVDWVGISMYPLQYFMGKDDQNPRTKENNDTAFLAGPNANPLLRVKPIMEFMEKNNIKKPVMITELGMHHKVKTLNKDTTAWGNYQLQKTYSELIRQYPQIKGMCYFNTLVANTPNEYALFTSSTLLNTYNKYVADSIFIKAMGQESPISYGKVTEQQVINRSEGTVTLSASGYYPFVNDPGRIKVEYRVGGKWIASPNVPPYKVTLTPEQLALGNEITVKMIVDGNVVMTKNIKVQ